MQKRGRKKGKTEREISAAAALEIWPKIHRDVLVSFLENKPSIQKEQDAKNEVINRTAEMMIEQVPDAPLSAGQARFLIMLLQNSSPEVALACLGKLVESLADCEGHPAFERIYSASLALKIIDDVCAHHDNRERFVCGLPKGLRIRMIPFLANLPDKTAERIMESIFPMGDIV